MLCQAEIRTVQAGFQLALSQVMPWDSAVFDQRSKNSKASPSLGKSRYHSRCPRV